VNGSNIVRLRVGYEAAAARLSYQLSSSGTEVNGPGYGNYGQTGILKVDAGDIIAMKLVNATTGAHYWAFAHANERSTAAPSAIYGTTV